MSKIYDVIVLGAGPAGLAAGLYAGRSRRRRMQGFPGGSGQTWFLGDKAGQIQPACTRRKRRCCLFRLPVPWPDEKEKERYQRSVRGRSRWKKQNASPEERPADWPRQESRSHIREKPEIELEDGFSDRRPDQLRIP